MVDTMEHGELNYLFVYGSLRRGLTTPVLEQIADRIEWVGFGQVSGKLFDLGEYPGAILSEETASMITGELIRLIDPGEILELLDEYEGFNRENRSKSLFIREIVRVLLEDGTFQSAWIYWYNEEIADGNQIHENDYLHYLKKNKRGNSYGAL